MVSIICLLSRSNQEGKVKNSRLVLDMVCATIILGLATFMWLALSTYVLAVATVSSFLIGVCVKNAYTFETYGCYPPTMEEVVWVFLSGICGGASSTALLFHAELSIWWQIGLGIVMVAVAAWFATSMIFIGGRHRV